MRKLLFTLLFSTLQISVFTQSENNDNTNVLPTSRTMKVTERVIALTRALDDTDGTYSTVDSTVFSWSHGRSSMQHGIEIKVEDYDVSETKKYLLLPLRRLKTYRSDGKILSETKQLWQFSAGEWENVDRTLYRYSGDSLFCQWVEEWNILGKWDTIKAHFFHYGTDTTEDLFCIWNNELHAWENQQRIIRTFSGGKIYEKRTEQWNTKSSAWTALNYEQWDYLFTGSLLVKTTHSNWDMFLNSWVADNIDSSVYTAGVPSEKWFRFRTSGLWSDWLVEKYTYDSSRLLQSYRYTISDGTTTPLSRTNYTYAGGTVTALTAELFTLDAKWENYSRTLFEYNTNGNLISREQQQWIANNWKPLVENDMLDTRVQYYYEPFSTAIPQDRKKLSATVFPNPAATYAYVDFASETNDAYVIVLRNGAGQHLSLLQEDGYRGDHSVCIPLQEYAPGSYFISIYCKNILEQSLMVIKQ